MSGLSRRIKKVTDETKFIPKEGSYFKGTSDKLTMIDIRHLSMKCMSSLIEASKNGELMDINSIIKQYWERELGRMTPTELLGILRKYGDPNAPGISMNEMDQSLNQLSGRKDV